MSSPKAVSCPWCRTNLEWGVLVCRGCNSDIFYSATGRELARRFAGWLVLSFTSLRIAALLAPSMTADSWADVGATWKLSALVALTATVLYWRRRRGNPFFYRRRSTVG
jgi:hypothetical protein